MTPITRTKMIRTALGLSQQEMAERLGVSQPTVFRLEQGQRETGPLSLLLTSLAEAHQINLPAAPDGSLPPAAEDTSHAD